MKRRALTIGAGAAVAALALFGVGAGIGSVVSGGSGHHHTASPTTPQKTTTTSPTSTPTSTTVTPATTAPSSSTTAVATTATCGAPNPANPVYSHLSGNRMIDTANQTFAPNGMTVYGLAYTGAWAANVVKDEAMITTAATSWCTSYIRLQLSPAVLLAQTPYNSSYLTAIDTEVQTALRLDENVMLTAQTEHSGDKPLAPDAATVQFWKVIASKYSGNPRIWFDLFNEPRAGGSDVWPVWHDGNSQYVGMQALAQDVRAVAKNLIIVEGTSGAQSLRDVLQYPIKVSDVVYGIHPYHQFTQTLWQSTFGTVAKSVPVLVTEWSEYSRGVHECTPQAAQMVPAFLSYLKGKDIGLGAWALVPGVLVSDTKTFTPTAIGADYSCNPAAAHEQAIAASIKSDGVSATPTPEGAGQLIQQFFRNTATPAG